MTASVWQTERRHCRRSRIVEDMISKVESTAEKDRVTRDEMILVVATIMKAMMGLKTKNGRLSTSVNTEFGADSESMLSIKLLIYIGYF
jgi:hypothetical protein